MQALVYSASEVKFVMLLLLRTIQVAQASPKLCKLDVLVQQQGFHRVSSQCQQCRARVINNVPGLTSKRHRQLSLGTENQQRLQQEMALFTADGPQ